MSGCQSGLLTKLLPPFCVPLGAPRAPAWRERRTGAVLPAGARVGWARLRRQRRARAQVVWSVLIDAVPTHGRNAQQITGAVTKQIKTYAKLLNEFTATAKLEAALLVHVQARRPCALRSEPQPLPALARDLRPPFALPARGGPRGGRACRGGARMPAAAAEVPCCSRRAGLSTTASGALLRLPPGRGPCLPAAARRARKRAPARRPAAAGGLSARHARARARDAARPNPNPPPRAQVYCYEDSKLLKVFQAIVRALYDADVLGEDTIIWWAKKGAHPKGRNVFQRDMEPFIKWLEEAEAEGDEEEDEE